MGGGKKGGVLLFYTLTLLTGIVCEPEGESEHNHKAAAVAENRRFPSSSPVLRRSLDLAELRHDSLEPGAAG